MRNIGAVVLSLVLTLLLRGPVAGQEPPEMPAAHLVIAAEQEDAQPGAYMRALAARHGTLDTGVLAVYFADVDEWRVWIGDALAARFVGRPGTAREFTESGVMHDAKEAWLEDVFARAGVAFAAQPPGAAKALPLFQAEAIIDGLVARLGPQPQKTPGY